MELVIFITALVVIVGLVSLLLRLILPKSISAAEKLLKQNGKISNTVFEKPAGEVQLPIQLKSFSLFWEKGSYITDVFSQQEKNGEVFSFLLHGHTFSAGISLQNPIPGAGAVSQTCMRCWAGAVPTSWPEIEVWRRHAPGDVPPFCSSKRFSSGVAELDEKYVFAGDIAFLKYVSPQLVAWLKKYGLHVLISSGLLLLVDTKEISIPTQEEDWRKTMQDMTAWTSLYDVLNHQI